jgi:hypothetical protein
MKLNLSQGPNLARAVTWSAWILSRYDIVNDHHRMLPNAKNVMPNAVMAAAAAATSVVRIKLYGP